MKLPSGWNIFWGLRRAIIPVGLAVLFVFLMACPSGHAQELQTTPVVTSQSSRLEVTGTPTTTPEPEAVGHVGANVELVCGAIVLVIIIIAGLMRSARWMPYRGHDVEDEGE